MVLSGAGLISVRTGFVHVLDPTKFSCQSNTRSDFDSSTTNGKLMVRLTPPVCSGVLRRGPLPNDVEGLSSTTRMAPPGPAPEVVTEVETRSRVPTWKDARLKS